MLTQYLQLPSDWYVDGIFLPFIKRLFSCWVKLNFFHVQEAAALTGMVVLLLSSL